MLFSPCCFIIVRPEEEAVMKIEGWLDELVGGPMGFAGIEGGCVRIIFRKPGYFHQHIPDGIDKGP